jgi:hypothetical protein
MNIARSTFYYRRKTAHSGKDADVIDKIEEICLEFPGYGYRRVTEQLRRMDRSGIPTLQISRCIHSLADRVIRHWGQTDTARSILLSGERPETMRS